MRPSVLTASGIGSPQALHAPVVVFLAEQRGQVQYSTCLLDSKIHIGILSFEKWITLEKKVLSRSVLTESHSPRHVSKDKGALGTLDTQRGLE